MEEVAKEPEKTKTLDDILESIYVSDDETQQPTQQEEFWKLEDYDILSDLQVTAVDTNEDVVTAEDTDEELVYMEEN